MRPIYGFVLLVVALFVPRLTAAGEVSYSSWWGGCTLSHPGEVSLDGSPACERSGKYHAHCSVRGTIEGVAYVWSVSVSGRPIQANITTKVPAITFGEGALRCSVATMNVTGIDECRVSESGRTGSCRVCGLDGEKETCAAVSVRVSRHRAK